MIIHGIECVDEDEDVFTELVFIFLLLLLMESVVWWSVLELKKKRW